MSVLSKIVSYYPSTRATTVGVPTNLLIILQSDKPKKRILNLRASSEEVQKQLKDSLPCYTVAGEFNPRSDEGIIQLSGLAAVDLDSAEDYDVLYLLNELKKIPSIAYAGLSCRGKRLFCIIPFLYPDKYTKHYERLMLSFTDMGLPMGDTCHKTISQPRFISWNDHTTQFFNHDAQPYKLLPPERIIYTIKRSHSQSYNTAPENPFAWCNEQFDKSNSFSEGNRHEYIVHLARYCNIKGLTPEQTLNGCLRYAQPDFDEKEISKIVAHIYTTQADSHNKIPFTEPVKNKNKKQPEVAIKKQNEVQQKPAGTTVTKKQKLEIDEPVQENWNQKIVELETFFDATTLPTEPVKLNPATTISNVQTFIQSHLAIAKEHNGQPSFEPFLLRLIELKVYLTNNGVQ